MSLDLSQLRPEVGQGLALQGDFKNRARDISNAVLFALERRHLESLDLQYVPSATDLEDIEEIDYRFLKVKQIGHSAALDRSFDILNMQNILGTFRDGSHSFVLDLSSRGTRADLYLGARRLRTHRPQTQTAYDFVQNLQRTVEGNLPGTRFESFDGRPGSVICPEDEVISQILEPLGRARHLAALTGIPSLRSGREEQFAQSLDRMIQSLMGQRYKLLIIAEPLQEFHVSQVLENCLRLNTEVHSWVRVSASYAQAIGESVAQARASGKVTSDQEARAWARNAGKSISRQPTVAAGGLVGAGLALMMSAAPGLGAAAFAVSNMASSVITGGGGSISDTVGDSESTSRSRSWSESVTESLTESSSRTETASVNVEYLNKTSEYCESVVEGYVQRLQRGKNLGMWNVGVYFLADDSATFAQGQAQLRSLYSGRETYYEPMRSVDLSARGVMPSIVSILSTFSNPEMSLMDATTGEPLHHPLGRLHRSLSTPLNTEELSLLTNLPRREVPGIKLQLVADFGANPTPLDPHTGIEIGRMVSSGTELNVPVGVSLPDLTRHAFVTGITGSGKTNTCFALLKAMAKRGVPTLVIEPAKGEYRGLLRDPDIPGLRVYTPGDETISPFRINPFQFVPGMNLITHLDNLKSIFNAAFPMYASMPYMLEEAIVQCYEDRGWDLVDSTNKDRVHCDMVRIVDNWKQGIPDYSYTVFLPTLSDLLAKIDTVVRSKRYAEEASSNFVAALKARIGSLLLGSKKRMLDVQRGIGFEELFGMPTVLELRSVGDDDEKCFLMALLLVQLYEYREQMDRWHGRSGLQHLTVLEESHRLLGRAASISGSGETANPRGKAVDSFANMLAEIREYGEGFLIIDQTPAKLIPDVIKNTSTKILHRLTAREDRDALGDAMGMTDAQKQMVPTLRVGEAIFHSQDFDKPIWMAVPAAKGPGRERSTDDFVRERMAPHKQNQRESEMWNRLRSSEVRAARMAKRLPD